MQSILRLGKVKGLDGNITLSIAILTDGNGQKKVGEEDGTVGGRTAIILPRL